MREQQHLALSPVRVFYAYADTDELLRQELDRHLSILRQQGLITEIHNQQILAGTDWVSEMHAHLMAAQVILLLVSPHFLASAYCYGTEVQLAMQRHRNGDACVIPVILRPVDWQGAPFASLACLPKNAKPVTTWSNRGQAFLEVAVGIRRVIETFHLATPLPSPLSPSNIQIDERKLFQPDRSILSHHTATPMTDDTIFLFNVPLTDSNKFFGRIRERTTMLNRSRKGASTSLVGPRRIGKTWLMSYLRLVASKEFGSYWRIGYLDATSASCATISGFTFTALKVLGLTHLSSHPAQYSLEVLESAIQDLKSKGEVALLCIDEFEGLCRRQTFTLDFFLSLRAMTQVGLCLVVASKRPLIDIVGDDGQTSGFFNVFEQLTLEPFTHEEALTFVEATGAEAGFTKQEQGYILQYGCNNGEQWPPLRLQLAGTMLFEDKSLAAQAGTQYYRPLDSGYWQEFKQRLEEKYRGVVR